MKILVPTDLSENAENALAFAKAYALQQDASITLLYSYYAVYDFAAQAAEIIQTIENDAKKALKKAIKSYGDGVQMDYKIIQGTVSTAVYATVSNGDYDLVIMGTQGASGIKKKLIGSNTATVIKESEVPVIAVPFGASFDAVREIDVALELENENEGMFKKLISLTETWNLPYRVIHVITKPDFNKKILFRGIESYVNENFPDSEFTFEKLEDEDVDKALDHFLEDKPACMLVMFSKDKGFFDLLFKSSHSVEMAYHTHLPLLVIK
ncbi:Nucleotide-binding universal stress protein, UspA family [Cyclobacterium lianum]|uniref:Nucleotide-binding universal stress protein, UspA family n=1 Tax=Cyclobacterium lianum TaxID=388280 RepID=A0A1M7NXD0_9BACT|nr:universal stress protein [Cyclobacterium lianum]SHN08288.1 Nucleotide-binding universal stress protein, UspA family [Cyclobacterium lianum]